jgi:hypothetical protein
VEGLVRRVVDPSEVNLSLLKLSKLGSGIWLSGSGFSLSKLFKLRHSGSKSEKKSKLISDSASSTSSRVQLRHAGRIH